MSFWMQRSSFKIASIVRYHSHAQIESHPSSQVAQGAETLWFIKVVCNLCIFRSPSNLNVFSDYFRKNLNSFVAFRVIQLLNNRYNNPRLAFSFFQYTRLDLNLTHSIYTFNFLLRSFCEKGCHDSAKSVFDYMNLDGHLPDDSILELLVHSFANSGKFNIAKEILISQAKLSYEKERIVSPFVYNDFLNLLVKRNLANEAANFFEEHVLRVPSFSLDTSTFNIIIRGLCNVREVDKALNFFRNMRNFGCFPDTITYNSLINGLCKAGKVNKGRELLKEMKLQGGVSVDVVSYTSIISGCCKLGKMDEAIESLDEMIIFGIKPNLFTFNALIDGFGKIGDMISALKILQKMLILGYAPDVITYTSLINSYCNLGKVDQGLKLYNEMNSKNLLPNLYTFSVLINAFSKENRLNEARDLLTELKSRDDIIPRPFIYNPVIDGFCKAGNVDEANVIVAEMEEKGCKSDKLTFTILILGHCMKGRMFEAIEIFNKMIVLGCEPDKITVNSLVSCLLKAGMGIEAGKIKQMGYEGSFLKRDVNMDITVAV